jgi:hypothetical protein
MKLFAPLVLLPILCASAIPLGAKVIFSGKTFNGADRTITWRPWQQHAKDEFRFRTGDRYLGRAVWEHYLGFEQLRTSSKTIKLSMIRLGNEDVREEVVLRPGSRYAIFKVTNGTMNAHKGVWRDRASGPLKPTRFWVARLKQHARSDTLPRESEALLNREVT